MSDYHYIQSEPGLWTVGTGRPGKGGDWEPESDHDTPEAAAERVRYLNGGYGTSKDATYISSLEKRIAELEEYVTDAGDWFGRFCVHAPYQFGGEIEMGERAEALLKKTIAST